MVGSKIYENDSYLRAVVGNYRESGAMQFKKFDFFFISPKDPFGKLFLKTVTMFKSSSEAPFLRKIRKFKIGLNLEITKLWKLGHFQNARTKKRKAVYTSSLQALIHISQSYFQAIFYLDLVQRK